MALRIGPAYKGRFHAKAKELITKGVRVGMMWVGTGEEVHCHVCDKDFPPPALDEIHHDHFGECPHCKTPFVFADAIRS